MAVNPDTSTALPVLRDKMPGVFSSAKRLRMWIPFVTPIPMTSGSVMIFDRLIGMSNKPIKPASQIVPIPTGSSARITAPKLRKWKRTINAMAVNEYQAAVT